MDLPPAQDQTSYSAQPLHIERGARVLGPDGELGTLRQMIVAQDTGDLRRLVVRSEAGLDIELPADRIVSASSQGIFLSIGLRDLADHPELAQPYSAERYSDGDGEGEQTADLPLDAASQFADMTTDDLETGGYAGPMVRLAVVGIIVGAATGGLVYLFSRQRAAPEPLPAATRTQRAWQVGTQSARAGLDQLLAASRNASATMSTTAQTAGATLSDASQTLATTLGDTLANTLANAGTLATALLASARSLWPSRPVATTLTRAAAVPPVVVARVSAPARSARLAVAQGRQRARRGARRLARRVRWLRNGLILGAVLGVLYAPESGREARARLSRTLRNIPWLDALLVPAAQGSSVPPAPGDLPTGVPSTPNEADLWGAPPERATTRYDLPPTVH